jgi:predicted small secreted protein
MNTKIKRIGLMITLLILIAGFMGCNTMEGAGKDIEKAGEGIQDAAD